MIVIRSQDKTRLIHCNEIWKCEKEIRGLTLDINGELFATLGNYETEKRCMEILDEIQQHINGWKKINPDKRIGRNVYQMPEK